MKTNLSRMAGNVSLKNFTFANCVCKRSANTVPFPNAGFHKQAHGIGSSATAISLRTRMDRYPAEGCSFQGLQRVCQGLVAAQKVRFSSAKDKLDCSWSDCSSLHLPALRSSLPVLHIPTLCLYLPAFATCLFSAECCAQRMLYSSISMHMHKCGYCPNMPCLQTCIADHLFRSVADNGRPGVNVVDEQENNMTANHQGCSTLSYISVQFQQNKFACSRSACTACA